MPDFTDMEVSDWSRLPKEPLASVWIVTYQQADHIARALTSVLSQKTDFPFEVCVGEDGSEDGTRSICEDYARQYPERIRLFLRNRENPERKKYNAVLMHNFIETIKACRGKYIAFIEGDDYWTDPLKLQKQVSFLESHKDYSFVHADFDEWDASTNLYRRHAARARHAAAFKDEPIRPDRAWWEFLTQRRCIYTLTVTAVCALVKEVVNQAPEFRNWLSGDLTLWLELAKRGWGHFQEDCVAVHQYLSGSVSNSQRPEERVSYLISLDEIRRHYARKWGCYEEALPLLSARYPKMIRYAWLAGESAALNVYLRWAEEAHVPLSLGTRLCRLARFQPVNWLRPYRAVRGWLRRPQRHG